MFRNLRLTKAMATTTPATVINPDTLDKAGYYRLLDLIYSGELQKVTVRVYRLVPVWHVWKPYALQFVESFQCVEMGVLTHRPDGCAIFQCWRLGTVAMPTLETYQKHVINVPKGHLVYF